jgi:hypothetical protein
VEVESPIAFRIVQPWGRPVSVSMALLYSAFPTSGTAVGLFNMSVAFGLIGR